MFGTIRKHQNWLWLVIIFVIIVTFVIFFSPDVRLGANRPAEGEFGSIGGRQIGQEEFRDAHQEARMAFFMRSNGREWPGSDAEESLKRDAIFRVFLKEKMKEMDIRASDEAVGRIVRERLGNYKLADFERDILAPQALTLQDFERFLRHEAALQQLVNTAGVSAKLLNPREAEILYRKENEAASTEVALFSASNRLDQVTIAELEVAKFFTNRMPLYRVPERVRVSYVAFPATNYLAEGDKLLASITNLEARVEEVYYQRGTNTFTDTNGIVLSAADAKQQIKEEERLRIAFAEARRKATDFGRELMDQPQPEKLETFEKLAATNNWTIRLTEPFDRNSGLENTNFPSEFRQKALTLTTNAPVIFNPIAGPTAWFVLALKERIPSEMPPFEKVQEKVTADYRFQQALEAARKAATNFHAAVTNVTDKEKPFVQLAAQHNAKLITPAPFTPSTTSLTNLPPTVNLRMLQQFGFEMKPGDVSGIIPTFEGAMVVYLKERKEPEESKVKAELPEFLARLRLYRQNEAFNQWFRKQVEQARVVIPQPPAPAGAPPGQPPPQTRS
ncbi:MAG: peptidylprolyl isomerase [Verrucomicrobia subdivision 3 bacterium]|nr:peptidylprolyl isomerase [Limisphaerales bacterium]